MATRSDQTASAATSGADEHRAATHGDTHAAVDGAKAPRLPHERDESSDSGSCPPSEVMRRAHDDVVDGKTGTDRDETTDALHHDTLRGKTPGSERD